MTLWRGYEREVSQIAGDLFISLTGSKDKVQTTENAWLPSRHRGQRHQIDVLARDGDRALFIECKHRGRELDANDVKVALYNFRDVCVANPDRRWGLALVSQAMIPRSARLVPMKPEGVHGRPRNLWGRSLADSVYFVYFGQQDGSQAFKPFYVTGAEQLTVGAAGIGAKVDPDDCWDRLNCPHLPLEARVDAGLCLAVAHPAILACNAAGRRVLVHGLMHSARVPEAMYIHGLGGRASSADAVIDGLMMRYMLARLRYPGRQRGGWRSVHELIEMIDGGTPRQRLSIETFAGPVIVRFGDEYGFELLDDVERDLRGLDSEDAQYYEILRLVRMAQLVTADSRRLELIQNANELVDGLPAWNRDMASALMEATRTDIGLLHGIDSPFDATAWGST